MTDSNDNAATTNPLAQLRLARRRPLAALLGATPGFVPVGVYWVGHHELTSWAPWTCPKAMIVYAGLLFSVLTVYGWSADMFGSKVKALGFTVLIEGIMMTAAAGWLNLIALGYLVAINAIANGCRLALRDTAADVDWRTSLARGIAAAAAATAAQARKPERRARSRRARPRAVAPRLAAVSGSLSQPARPQEGYRQPPPEVDRERARAL
jgi:hypothetical protein